MTKQETAQLLAIISATYPNFKVENKTQTIDAWHWSLEEYPFNAIQMAYKVYIKTDKSGFAPSVNQLITNLQKPAELNSLSEGEAWALVKKAIQNGNYGAEEEYNKLPEIVQKAVGSPNMIRQWAMSDTAEVNTVIASNFQRTYKSVVQRESQKAFVGNDLRLMELASSVADKLSIENKG